MGKRKSYGAEWISLHGRVYHRADQFRQNLETLAGVLLQHFDRKVKSFR